MTTDDTNTPAGAGNEQATDTRWKPGTSGNPSGRKPGTGRVAEFRKAIQEHVPDIVAQLVKQAKEGDVSAARLLLERAVPALRPDETATPIELRGSTLTDQGRDVFGALATGDLSPSQASQLMGALAGLAKLIETTELEQRIRALESRPPN